MKMHHYIAVLWIGLGIGFGLQPAQAQHNGTQNRVQKINLSALHGAAEAGDVEAQVTLADLYDIGDALPQDHQLALKWYRVAATKGNSRAQNRVGSYLRSGLGGPKDPELAVVWLKRAAESDHPVYVYDLAQMYEHGAGVAQDFAKAASLYTLASTKGLHAASVSLGVLYQNGTGVAQDFDAARALYEAAADAGNLRAQNNLGLLYTRGDGVAQDYEKAAKLFMQAAEAGNATAMTNLGVMYANGFGVEQSDDLAAQWYRRAGQNQAETLAEKLAEIGFVFDPRLQQLEYTPDNLSLLQNSAQRGDPVAQFLLAYLLVTGPDAQASYPQAAHWFKAAAEAKIPSAMANLGLLYHQGLGVIQDYTLGHMWLTLAASSGTPEHAKLRDLFLTRMTAAQLQEAQQMAKSHWTQSRVSQE